MYLTDKTALSHPQVWVWLAGQRKSRYGHGEHLAQQWTERRPRVHRERSNIIMPYGSGQVTSLL